MRCNWIGVVVVGLGLNACTHQPTVMTETTDLRNPANNTGDVGSVDDRQSTATWYSQELAKNYMATASRIAQARTKGLICDGDFYHRDVIDLFGRAVSNDANVAIDTDVRSQIASTFTYRMYLLNKREGYVGIEDAMKKVNFDGVAWRSIGQGVFGTTLILTQKNNGVLEVSELNMDTLKWEKKAGQWKVGSYASRQRQNGSYRREATVLFLTYSGKTRAYDIMPDQNGGYLLVPYNSRGLDYLGTKRKFTDFDNSECEA